MKTPEASERQEEAIPAPTKKQGEVGIRLVSRPDQKVLREWEITLPDELVARLTLNIEGRYRIRGHGRAIQTA